MKNKFWPTSTIFLVVLSAIFIYSLRRQRIENTTLKRNLHSCINEFSTMIKDQELKILPPMVYSHKFVIPGSFEEAWESGTVYLRIHDSICLPCSSFTLDNIVNNYVNSKRFNVHVLGSYGLHHNFLGDMKKLGLDQIAHTNSTDELGFIGADSLNVPYLFTISEGKVSTLLILKANKDIELEAYFNMIDRLFHSREVNIQAPPGLQENDTY